MELGIEKVVLGFENVEIMEIPAWYIADFSVCDIETVIARQASNSIDKVKIANNIILEIAKEFGDKKFTCGYDPESKLTNFERISKCNDITSIEIFYEREYITDQEKSEIYLVDYDEKDDYLGAPNINQEEDYDVCGNMLITIGKNTSFKEIREQHMRQDKDSIESTYRCYDIGQEFSPKHIMHLGDDLYDFPEDGIEVWVSDKSGHKGCHAYRKDGKWVLLKYDFNDDMTEEEIYSWHIDRTKYDYDRDDSEFKIDGLAIAEIGGKK